MTTITEDDVRAFTFRTVLCLDMAKGGFSRTYRCVEHPDLTAVICRPSDRKTVTTTFFVRDTECADQHAAAKALTDHLRTLEWEAAAPKEARTA